MNVGKTNDLDHLRNVRRKTFKIRNHENLISTTHCIFKTKLMEFYAMGVKLKIEVCLIK